jgi:hypothetical protein
MCHEPKSLVAAAFLLLVLIPYQVIPSKPGSFAKCSQFKFIQREKTAK